MSKKIEINDLDFFGIKNNLKTYLSGLDEFKDFNFEGSGTSILLDLLAYVTHYQGFYNNMVANEMFLDSAVKRTSVVSHAKSLGYTPTSSTAATAVVDVTINNTDSSTTYLTKRTKFTAAKDSVSYTFSNVDTEEFEVLNSTQKIARNVTIVEGTWRNASFVVDSNLSTQRFIIADKNIDTSRMTVNIQTSTTNTSGYADTWSPVSDITALTPTSKVYFLQETEEGQYELYFGDGILGTALADGNLITVNYLVTNGVGANDIGSQDSESSRSFSSSLSGVADIAVVTSSNGGSGKETLASIKFNAPKAFQSQNRNVTTNDYKSYIETNYTNASDVFVWGGEDNNPPEFGKVFVAVKPSNSTVLNNEEKISLQNLIKGQNIVSVIPDVVDPDYTYLKINTKVYFDADKTTKSASDIRSEVINGIVAFKLLSLEKFSRNLRYSKFVKDIDDTDQSIISNETSIILEKRITPSIGQESSYTIKFENPIYHPVDGYQPVVNTSEFTYTKTDGSTCEAHIDDDGSGKLRLYELVGGVRTYILTDIGDVNYATGTLSIEKLNPTSILDGILKITVEPENRDILAERSSILLIDTGDSTAITVNVEAYKPYGTNISSGSVQIASTETTTTTTSSASSSSSSLSSSSSSSSSSGGGGSSPGGGGGGGYGGGY